MHGADYYNPRHCAFDTEAGAGIRVHVPAADFDMDPLGITVAGWMNRQATSGGTAVTSFFGVESTDTSGSMFGFRTNQSYVRTRWHSNDNVFALGVNTGEWRFIAFRLHKTDADLDGSGAVASWLDNDSDAPDLRSLASLSSGGDWPAGATYYNFGRPATSSDTGQMDTYLKHCAIWRGQVPTIDLIRMGHYGVNPLDIRRDDLMCYLPLDGSIVDVTGQCPTELNGSGGAFVRSVPGEGSGVPVSRPSRMQFAFNTASAASGGANVLAARHHRHVCIGAQ